MRKLSICSVDIEGGVIESPAPMVYVESGWVQHVSVMYIGPAVIYGAYNEHNMWILSEETTND